MHQIETARLLLRMFTLDDLDDLAPIFGDPDVVRYLGEGKPASREETETALISIIKHWERHGFGRWAVVHKEHRRLIGYGGLRSLYDTPEVVYLLAKEYWGMGLATEIAKACLRYGFETHHFDRIVAIVKPENMASRRVLAKVNMKYEMETSYYNINVVQYTISRAEYQTDDSPYLLREIP